MASRIRIEMPDQIQFQENGNDNSFTRNRSDTLSDILFKPTKFELCNRIQHSSNQSEAKSPAEDINPNVETNVDDTIFFKPSGILLGRTSVSKSQKLISQKDVLENINPNAETNADDTIFLKPSEILLGRTSVSKSRKSIDHNEVLKNISNSPSPLKNKIRRRKFLSEETNVSNINYSIASDSFTAPKQRKLQAKKLPNEIINFSGNKDTNNDSVVRPKHRSVFCRYLERNANDNSSFTVDSVDSDETGNSVVIRPKRNNVFRNYSEGKMDDNSLPELDSVNSSDSSIKEKKIGFARKFRAENEKLQMTDIDFSQSIESPNESITVDMCRIKKRSRFNLAPVDFEPNFSYVSTTASSQVYKNEEEFDVNLSLRNEHNDGDEKKMESDGDETLINNTNHNGEHRLCNRTVTESDSSNGTFVDNRETCDVHNFSNLANTSAISLGSNLDIEITANMNLMEVVDVTVNQSLNDSNVLKKSSTLEQIYKDMIISAEESSFISLPMVEVRSKSNVPVEIDEVRNCETLPDVDENISQQSHFETLQISMTELEINSGINSSKENGAISDTLQCSDTDLTNNINSGTYCIDRTVEDSVTCIIPRIVPAKDMNCTYMICRENINEMSIVLGAEEDDLKQVPLPVSQVSVVDVNEKTMAPEVAEIVFENSKVVEEVESLHRTITNDSVKNGEGGITFTIETEENPAHFTSEINLQCKNSSLHGTEDRSCVSKTADMTLIDSCENNHAKDTTITTRQNTENEKKIEEIVNADSKISVENFSNYSNTPLSFNKSSNNLNEPNIVAKITIVESVTSSEYIEERLPTQEASKSIQTEEYPLKNTEDQINVNEESNDNDGEIFTINHNSLHKSMVGSDPINTPQEMLNQFSIQSSVIGNIAADTDNRFVHPANVRRSSRISFRRSQSEDKSKSNGSSDSAFSFVRNLFTGKRVSGVKRKTQPSKQKNTKRFRCFNIDDLDESIQRLRKKPIFPKHFHPYCNDRFYAYLIKKMTSKYGARTNREVVKVAEYIWQTVKEVEAMSDPIEYNAKVKEMKECLYRKQLVRTHYDFYMWCHFYMTQRFNDKAVAKLWNPDVDFDPYTLYDDIVSR